ncbi:MAG: J domain-containing protein [Lacisediminihabitans sp.]
MPDSPISATPYEVLGVSASASADELRRAYRRMLRETHPDTGGNPARFHAVQRAWERVGRPADRAAYDRGRSPASSEPARAAWATRPPRKPKSSRPLARSYGHPGGWYRERYLALLREWVGRGVPLDDPYEPALVRSAPRHIRHLLAHALVEEATARSMSELGIAYTMWHDVATDAAGGGRPEKINAAKLDHIVLGPTGLFAVLSEDWGGPVRVRRGELIGEVLGPGERPMHSLSLRARSIARAARVRFTALVIVVPDEAGDDSLPLVGRTRGVTSVLIQSSRLAELMRNGVAGAPLIGGTELFEVRTRLQAAVRFV